MLITNLDIPDIAQLPLMVALSGSILNQETTIMKLMHELFFFPKRLAIFSQLKEESASWDFERLLVMLSLKKGLK